jgi:hypothetical protein
LTHVAQLSIAVIPKIDGNDVFTNVDELNRTDSWTRRKTGWMAYFYALDQFWKCHRIRSVFLRLDRRRWRELNPTLGSPQQKTATFFTSSKKARKHWGKCGVS